MARERSCERDRGDRLHGACACAGVRGRRQHTSRPAPRLPPDVVATLSDRVEYRNVGTRVGDTVRIAQLVKGVQVYGESLDDTIHERGETCTRSASTSFVVPVRRSDSHIWSSANEPELGKGARRHRRRIRRRNQHQARDPRSAARFY